MGRKTVAVFGNLALVQYADGTEVVVDRVDGSVYAFPSTVDSTASAEEPLRRSEEEQLVA